MTIVQNPPQSGEGHAGKRWYRFGHDDEAVRHTDAWEHETFAEEQARWERSDPEYARICEAVRQAKRRGEEASRCADEAKAEWDARVATQRQADDDAQKAHHALKADQTARRQTASSREASSPATEEPTPAKRSDAAPGDPRSGRFHMATPVHVHDQPMLAKLLGVIRGDKYMVDAYPPAWHRDATTRDGDGLVRPHRDGALGASPESAVRPGTGEVERAVPPAVVAQDR